MAVRKDRLTGRSFFGMGKRNEKVWIFQFSQSLPPQKKKTPSGWQWFIHFPTGLNIFGNIPVAPKPPEMATRLGEGNTRDQSRSISFSRCVVWINVSDSSWVRSWSFPARKIRLDSTWIFKAMTFRLGDYFQEGKKGCWSFRKNCSTRELFITVDGLWNPSTGGEAKFVSDRGLCSDFCRAICNRWAPAEANVSKVI